MSNTVPDPIPPKRDERFPKIARVVNQLDFDRVFKTGVIASDDILVVHACRNDLGKTRLGLSISKRVGNSPVRNLWKRYIRESFRKQRADLPPGFDLVVRPKKGAVPNHMTIQESLPRLCNRLAKKLPI